MKDDRYARIVDLVNTQGKITVNRLAEAFDVSATTIRKDLDELAARGLLRREHGFATVCAPNDISKRQDTNYEAKVSIAQLAASLVAEGETIEIESGSTCALLTRQLASSKKSCTVITNSATIADIAAEGADMSVILLGGIFQRESRVTVGPMLRSYAQQFHVDKLFIGTDGFDVKAGFTANNLLRIEAEQALAASAEKTFVLTDSSKFKSAGVMLQLPYASLHGVVTDASIPPTCREALEAHGVELLVAGA